MAVKQKTPVVVMKRRRIRRTESMFTTAAFSLPRELARRIEKSANDEYGGNKSALATEALAQFFGETPESFMAAGAEQK